MRQDVRYRFPMRVLAPFLDAVERRTGLSRRSVVFGGAVLTLVVGSATVFGGLLEDVTANNGLARSDRAHLHPFIAHRSAALVDVARGASDAASIAVLIGVAVVVAWALWRRGVNLVWAGTPAVSLGIAAVAASLIKQLVGRPRPPLALRLATEHEPSFPSGHATDITALAVAVTVVVAIVVLRRPLARVGVVASGVFLAAAVGLSRLVLGVHWPTDVAAGWALGATVAMVTVLVAALVARSNTGDGAESVGAVRKSARLRSGQRGGRVQPLRSMA